MTTRFGTLLQEELVPVLSRFLTAAGENAETGTQAAKLVLPAVLAGVLKSTAGNPDYASALYRQAGAESGLSADEVQAQSERLIDLGNSLLPAVFDGNAADAAAELARQSGIAKASAARLLAMALPQQRQPVRLFEIAGRSIRSSGGKSERRTAFGFGHQQCCRRISRCP